MIIEGLLTTTASDGSPHVAPLGPVVDEELQTWTLRPFSSSTTFRYLREHPHCVFHVVDDVLPVVEATLGLPSSLSFEPLESQSDPHNRKVLGWTIPSACHWYQLEVTDWDTSQPRCLAYASLIGQRIQRPFWGWNRAKHAILEATILASRVSMLDRREIEQDLSRLEPAIQKTAGDRELIAWALLKKFFQASE